jgi:hypothetical protein
MTDTFSLTTSMFLTTRKSLNKKKATQFEWPFLLV